MLALLMGRILAWKTLVQCSISVEIPKVAFRNVQNLHSRRFHISVDVGCCHCCFFCIYSGFLALECNQFANFRYFAAFANVQVFGSLAFFLAGYRLLPALFAIYEYFVLFLHSSASNAVCCLFVRSSIPFRGVLLSFVLALPSPIGLCK